MTRANADAFAAMVDDLNRDTRPPVTLSAREADSIREALRQADIALNVAEGSKLREIRSPAREARIRVQAAWGLLDRLTPKHTAIQRERCVLCGDATGIDRAAPVAERARYAHGVGQLCETCGEQHGV